MEAGGANADRLPYGANTYPPKIVNTLLTTGLVLPLATFATRVIFNA
jgi:hypothetical protein